MDLIKGLVEYDKGRFADPYANGVQRFDKLANYVDMAIKGLGDNTSSAIEVAKALYYIRKEELYKDYPIPDSNGLSVFQDFNTFCKEVFKCRKSTVYNYIALYETFGGDSNEASATPSDFNVSDYTYTQLLLMLPLSAPERLNIKSNWTCKQIKDYVKECKGKVPVTSKSNTDYGDFNFSKAEAVGEVVTKIASLLMGGASDFSNGNSVSYYRGYINCLLWVLEKLGYEYPNKDSLQEWRIKCADYFQSGKNGEKPE